MTSKSEKKKLSEMIPPFHFKKSRRGGAGSFHPRVGRQESKQDQGVGVRWGYLRNWEE